MSETDKAAIEIVRNLQTNIRRTTIALIGIFAIALLTAVFWGGGINNQVNTNKDDIGDLTKTVKEGIAGTPMVSYAHLGDETIANIAAYILELGK